MAVYTHIGERALRDFLALYDLGGLHAFKGIAAGVENSNYLLETDKGRFILTLYEKRVREEDLPFFLGLMRHLAAKGLPCPTPVADKGGITCQNLAGRPAAIITYLDGYEIDEIAPHNCHAVGEALARLHIAGQDFPQSRPNDLSIEGWRHLAKQCEHGIASAFPELPSLISHSLNNITAHWPQDLPQGIIHADLFPDNVFFLEDRLVGLIDFYFACTDALAYDIAVCANAWCFDQNHEFTPARYDALLQGYEKIRPLEDVEKRALPWLLQGSALRFLLTRAHDWLHRQEGALVTAKNPMDYAKRLKHWQANYT